MCSDLASHVEVHTPAVSVDPATGDLLIAYVQVADDDGELPQGNDPAPGDDDWDAGGFGLSA